MPQIKKSAKKDVSFSVSPWQSKKATPEITEDQLYIEIQLPLKRKIGDLAEVKTEPLQRPRTSQHKGFAQQWQRKKQEQTADEGSVVAEQLATDKVDGPDPAYNYDSDADTDTDITDTRSGSVLHGTGVFALLPSGQISGHILDSHSNACFGFMAHQLTAERECTRDTEWRLLHATIIDYKSSKEINFAAERLAEDAATIQAPLQMHGEEEQVIAALQDHTDAVIDIRFIFQCTTILVSYSWECTWCTGLKFCKSTGCAKSVCRCMHALSCRLDASVCSWLQANDAADTFLMTFNPKLRGKDAVVNKGDVQISKLPFARCFSRHPQKPSNVSLVPAAHAYDSDFDD